MLPFSELTSRLLAATMDQKRAAAVVEHLRGIVQAEATRRYKDEGQDRWKDPLTRLGGVRLDGVDAEPSLRIVKPADVGSWLAERAPATVETTIRVPAEHLAAALTALDFAQIPGVEASVAPTSAAGAWLAEHTTIAYDQTGAYVVRDDNGDEVPGVTAGKAAVRLVVTPDKDLLAEDKARALAELADGDVEVTPIPAPRTPAEDLTDLRRDELAKRCADAGLPTSGTKVALARRIEDHLASQGAGTSS